MFHIFYIELDVETNFQNWGLFEAFYGAFLLGYPALFLEKTVVRMMSVHSHMKLGWKAEHAFPCSKPSYTDLYGEHSLL